MKKFFGSLFNCLVSGSRAVLQFYPENSDQLEMITSAATLSGFSGGIVVDFPHSAKAKKYFLVLNAGTTLGPGKGAKGMELPKALGTGDDGENGMEDVDMDGEDSENNDNDMDDDGNRSVAATVRNDRTGGIAGDGVKVAERKKVKKEGGKKKAGGVKTKSWILKKKDQMRLKGMQVAGDSKFTGRKRKARF
jgi:18S rRNA (guanine1575-N7)-methyltransferase